jgi:hypothetical protein
LRVARGALTIDHILLCSAPAPAPAPAPASDWSSLRAMAVIVIPLKVLLQSCSGAIGYV